MAFMQGYVDVVFCDVITGAGYATQTIVLLAYRNKSNVKIIRGQPAWRAGGAFRIDKDLVADVPKLLSVCM